MKKVLLVALLSAGTATMFGQGSITFNNNVTGVFRAPIYNVDTTDSTIAKAGQTSAGTPTGSTVYTGALLQGTGWTVGFYAGTDASHLSLLGTSNFRTSSTGALPAGIFSTTPTVTVPGVLAGAAAAFQIRVWDNKGGTITTWEQASPLWMVSPGFAAGQTGVITSGPLGGTDAANNIFATPTATGWTSFQLTAAPVPEPTTFALAGLAGAAMLIFRRRK